MDNEHEDAAMEDMTSGLDKQNRRAARRHGHAAWISSMDMQHEYSVDISINRQHGHMDMQHGHEHAT
jgi:hypothetical protein